MKYEEAMTMIYDAVMGSLNHGENRHLTAREKRIVELVIENIVSGTPIEEIREWVNNEL